jgi:4-phytase/acid phosphatase
MRKTTNTHFSFSAAGLVLALIAASAPVFGQSRHIDDTKVKQVIILGRHGVRSPVVDNSTLNNFSTQPFPVFSVPGVSNLTVNGATNETILGGYFRLWLTQEGMLTGKDSADASSVYFRANNGQLIIDTAKAFWAGLLPGASMNINSYPQQDSDPLFSPVAAGVAQIDEQMAVAAVQGRLGDSAQSLTTAYGPELALTRSVLFNYPASQTPAPAAPAGKLDVTTLPIAITGSASPVSIGGLGTVVIAIDPFVMEYADGLPAAEVGWGQLTADSISQNTRLYNLALDLEYRTPYLARRAEFQCGLAYRALAGAGGHRKYHGRRAGKPVY